MAAPARPAPARAPSLNSSGRNSIGSTPKPPDPLSPSPCGRVGEGAGGPADCNERTPPPMSRKELSYQTWHTDSAREAAMEEGHRPLWCHFIQAVPETDLSTREVLDFGCNRGGFLRLLYALRPFR